MHWIDDSIVEEIQALHASRVLDLGCGVGASLIHIASRTNVHAIGVTISGVQAARARDLILRAGLAQRISVLEGSFLALDPLLPKVDLAFAVESFILAGDHARFFQEAERVLRPGGRLIVCDDFLNEEKCLSASELEWVETFRRGWHAASLLSSSEFQTSGENHGFSTIKQQDLSAHLELGRPRDVLVRALVSTIGRLPLASPYLSALRGGDALQRALRSGAIQYRVFTLQRQ
jgi:cyclopropane fatty-acyl-phospholipid synthase-like methyltransferase